MAFLQRVLKVQAIVTAVIGLALVFVPGRLLDRSRASPGCDEGAWLRAYGDRARDARDADVLVGQRVSEDWWWAWAFAVFEIATTATVLVERDGRVARTARGVALVGARAP